MPRLLRHRDQVAKLKLFRVDDANTCVALTLLEYKLISSKPQGLDGLKKSLQDNIIRCTQ